MPLSPENRARIAFALVVLALAAVVAAGWLLSRQRNTFYELRTHESVSGLIRGAPVEFHGVEVGKVEEVQLVDSRTVRVVLELDGHVPLTTSTVATISGRGLATRGFTGYVYVSLEEAEGGNARPLVPMPGQRYARVASGPSRTVSLDTSVNQLNESVQAVTALMRTTMDAQTIASLKQSVANLDSVTRTLAANNARLQAILANAERASAQMPPLVQSSTQALRTVQTQLLPQAGRTLVQMDDAIGAGRDTFDAMRTQVLPQAQQSLRRMDAVTGSLGDTADEVRRNPAVLVWGTRQQPGPGETP
jgi:phospholipid/cholesterol/gamma-HCH transport system substrate-binding protein